MRNISNPMGHTIDFVKKITHQEYSLKLNYLKFQHFIKSCITVITKPRDKCLKPKSVELLLTANARDLSLQRKRCKLTEKRFKKPRRSKFQIPQFCKHFTHNLKLSVIYNYKRGYLEDCTPLKPTFFHRKAQWWDQDHPW